MQAGRLTCANSGEKKTLLDGGSEPACRLDMKGFGGFEVFWRAQGVQTNKQINK